MVRESFEPGKSVSMVARQHGVNPNQLFHWRKLYQDGSLSAVSAGEEHRGAARDEIPNGRDGLKERCEENDRERPCRVTSEQMQQLDVCMVHRALSAFLP